MPSLEQECRLHQKWRDRWVKLANDRERMRAMGGLTVQFEYIAQRARTANRKVAEIMQAIDKGAKP